MAGSTLSSTKPYSIAMVTSRKTRHAALRIIAAYEQGPPEPDLVRRVEFHESFAPNRAPKYTTISDLAHRVVEHWFAPKDKDWKWYSRFSFTLAGSITFFLFWAGYLGGEFDYVEFNWTTLTFLIMSVAGPPWFAGITAWKELGYGPIRLFLSGLLLPYFVWSLVAIMYARPIPDFVGTPKSTSDVRRDVSTVPGTAPPSAVPAPQELLDLLEPETAPPQSSGQSS